MKRIACLSVLLTGIATAVSVSALSAAERLNPGQWEFTITRAGEAPNTFKQCINALEARSVNGDTASSRAAAEQAATAAGNGCKITDYRVAGDTVSYAMRCGAVSIRATKSYHGDKSEGDMFTSRNGGAEVGAHVTAKRVGGCP